jgi:hypothetical protein
MSVFLDRLSYRRRRLTAVKFRCTGVVAGKVWEVAQPCSRRSVSEFLQMTAGIYNVVCA